ncbi:hypothetical protein SAMN04488564_117117 [Lentzea waywayandensis]|uniref:Uncharacterized protein n=1 Tax=Lentzea waywayandensis TaxID=84724 RepID=A0A1I6FGW5_9PSEU|nr:hypothetical protein [Lentzea waywayandensis]SFR29193.1 hypothetical protein SAMN04488564_117117 [Lentzea waywayandensis]
MRDDREDSVRFATPASPSLPVVAEFDPFVRTVGVGPVPRFVPDLFLTRREVTSIGLRPENGGDQRASITVNTSGRLSPPRGEKLPDINGKRAWRGDSRVTFEWAHDAWAYISVEGFSNDRERSIQLAQAVRFDDRIEIKIPFTSQTTWTLAGVRDVDGDMELEFDNGVRVRQWGGTGLATGEAPQKEMEALGKSLRPSEPALPVASAPTPLPAWPDTPASPEPTTCLSKEQVRAPLRPSAPSSRARLPEAAALVPRRLSRRP